ncbi:precorrin-6y C5,15-methyltransferase (decarboxylating) subunit CbiE [Lichenibacterium ramalinae]|uniref:precorrin-6y C5,15-methyltransferase (decarboxylating) subunit CbiE n=1 Tax=Lichenibacterium ramalinae TaxID=2316527 RepID=UPI001FDEB206|nr:precorrin-6y C5,15-methyltransferase (decarboxylating) subunit CbiE [Lichenibacterium ramalinae]
MSAEPWLTLVGIGEDGVDGLSRGARDALAQAALVVGGRRHLALAGPVPGETLAWTSPMADTYPAILARRGTPVAVLASGDPFCHGVGGVLARHVPAAETRCFPQPSAFSLATARMGWAQQDCALVSLCGRPLETLVPALRPGARVVALSADAATPGRVAALLRERGFGAATVTVLEAMGGPRERVRAAGAEGFALDGIDPLNTLALAVAGPGRSLSLVPGRPDALFDHDGQITKADIRAVTLARLAPLPGEVLWDVGAGSGSVAIEWMLAHPANRAHAVERHPDRAARIRHNAATLGVPDLSVVDGAAPAALAGLPRPDAIFVGGGATGAGVLDACAAALKPGGRLVVSAVTIETQALLIARFRRDGGRLATLSTAEADPVGSFHGWRPAMPVTHWTWIKP